MRKGFSLVELMIVVAIIGILASIAVPQFREMQLKAKRSEAVMNARGIGDAASGYFATNDQWLSGCSSNPGAPLTKVAKAWRPNYTACWTALGWAPDGNVRCTYTLNAFGGGTWARASGECDVDDNNTSYIAYFYPATSSAIGRWAYTHPEAY